MDKLKKAVEIMAVIVKYSAVVMALITGIKVVHEELEKIDLGQKKKLDE